MKQIAGVLTLTFLTFSAFAESKSMVSRIQNNPDTQALLKTLQANRNLVCEDLGSSELNVQKKPNDDDLVQFRLRCQEEDQADTVLELTYGFNSFDEKTGEFSKLHLKDVQVIAGTPQNIPSAPLQNGFSPQSEEIKNVIQGIETTQDIQCRRSYIFTNSSYETSVNYSCYRFKRVNDALSYQFGFIKLTGLGVGDSFRIQTVAVSTLFASED